MEKYGETGTSGSLCFALHVSLLSSPRNKSMKQCIGSLADKQYFCSKHVSNRQMLASTVIAIWAFTFSQDASAVDALGESTYFMVYSKFYKQNHKS